MDRIFGIDVGGTQVKARAFAADGTVLASHQVSLESSEKGPQRVREALEILSRECGQSPDGIGIAAPGMAARDESCIAFLPESKVKLEGLRWAEFLNVEVPVRVLNDAHAALLGECWQGAARDYDNALLITLGTGVGGAILWEGQLFRGHLGRAGHFGHLCLDPDGEPGLFGMPGSLEDFIGEQTVQARTRGKFASTRDLVQAVEAGDAEADAIWRRSLERLACGLGSLINILDPEAIIIGGGMARAGDTLFRPLQEALDQLEWCPTGVGVKLVPAELGEWSGACGAAFRVRENPSREKPV